MYPDLAYPGFTWQITQHAGMVSPDLILGLLQACASQDGKEINISSIDAALVVGKRIPASGARSIWRDYQQVLGEFGFIVASASSGGVLRLTPIAKVLLAGRMTFQEVMTLQLMRYQYPNAFKRVIPGSVSSLLPRKLLEFDSLTKLQFHCGVHIRPFVLVWQVLDCLGKMEGRLSGLSRDELAGFVLKCKQHSDVSLCCEAIVESRKRKEKSIHTDVARRNAGDWMKLLLMTSVFSQSPVTKELVLSELAIKNRVSLQWLLNQYADEKSFWQGNDGVSWFEYYGSVDFDWLQVVPQIGKSLGWILPSFVNSWSHMKDISPTSLFPVALKLFAEKRAGEWLEEGRKVNAKVRDYFTTLKPEKLASFDENQIAELFCGVKDSDDKVIFVPMWSGGPGSGWSHIRPSSPAELQDVRDFLERLSKDVGVVSEFRQDGFKHPKGFGPAVVSELLMKFHPEIGFKYGQMTYEVLSELGLLTLNHPYRNEFSDSDYKQVCGIAARLLTEMSEMKLSRSINADGEGDGEPPDYLTVNEFVWFVNQNRDLIKERFMKMKLVMPDQTQKKAGKKTWKDVLSDNPNNLMNRLIAALLTKPFAILAGASGTGKSRMVRKLAYMTCLNTQLQPDSKTKKPIENFCMVQVKPNWHDSTDLLGYKSAISTSHKYVSTDFVRFILKAHAFPNTPFFVCLDEMNLAPVEHYFAEFLSASESAHEEEGEFITDPIINSGDFDGDISNLDPTGYAIPSPRKELIERIGLYIPKNLFIVGTVNMDDSTSGFSRKVVDRAMTLEMDEVNYSELQKTSKFDLFDRFDKDEHLEAIGVLLAEEQIAAFVNRCEFHSESLQPPLVNLLTELKDILHQTPLAIGYRFARECVQYRDAIKMLMVGSSDVGYDELALDHLILMKVLPRLVGNKDDHIDLINNLKAFLGKLKGHDLSANALERMVKSANHNGGYLSFYP